METMEIAKWEPKIEVVRRDAARLALYRCSLIAFVGGVLTREALRLALEILASAL